MDRVIKSIQGIQGFFKTIQENENSEEESKFRSYVNNKRNSVREAIISINQFSMKRVTIGHRSL